MRGLALRLATGVLLAAAAVAHAAGGGADVTIPARLYAPGELDLLAGETVTWRNTDTKSHTVTSDADLFDSGYLGPGSTFSETFRTTGVFTYHCRIHRSMRGVVRVFALILNGPPRPLPPAWASTCVASRPNRARRWCSSASPAVRLRPSWRRRRQTRTARSPSRSAR